MLSGGPRATVDRDMRLIAAPEKPSTALPPRPQAAGLNALVEYAPPGPNPEEEDLEVKLRRINEHVPLRVNNTSGSSAGSGSGDFHQYRQMRRKEQDRLARMDADYQKRQQLADFNKRREERLKDAEERTAKNRLKRHKKKQRKKTKLNASGGEIKTKTADSDDGGESDNEEKGNG